MKTNFRILALALLTLGGACGGSRARPSDVLKQYEAAARSGNTEALRSLSDSRFREEHDAASLEAWLRKNPRLFLDAAERLAGLEDGVWEVVVRTRNGDRIRLVREGDEWRVAEGGLLVAHFDTPEAAARTFFFAATGHLGLLRRCLPDADASRLASDYALGQHLYAQRERIFKARDAVGPITDGMAIVDGVHARIPYGGGKSIDLVLEGERWRVVDVE